MRANRDVTHDKVKISNHRVELILHLYLEQLLLMTTQRLKIKKKTTGQAKSKQSTT